jgi:hypothetical protein
VGEDGEVIWAKFESEDTMKGSSRWAPVLFVAALTGACSSSKPPPSPSPAIPVGASKRTLASLAGRWEGEYASPETGRTGSIVFELTGKKNVAYGDVLIVPKGSKDAKPGTTSEALLMMPQILQIRFVDAEGGGVMGTLDPYEDPSCACQVATAFTGQINGDVIEGKFTTTPVKPGPKPTGGTWRVTRVSKKVG